MWDTISLNLLDKLYGNLCQIDTYLFKIVAYMSLCFDLLSVKTIRKDEKRYYEDLLQYSQEHLMLYPYHLSDVIVKGLRVTPFIYYINMMSDIMSQEKSYDSLPNFTAADCKYGIFSYAYQKSLDKQCRQRSDCF